MFIDDIGFVQDSGGPGWHRGGLATRLNYHLLAPAVFSCFIERGKMPRWGIDGGKEGKRNYSQVKSERHGDITALKCSGFELAAGDRIMSTAAGGCGYGDPFTRDPEAVYEDVIDSYVSFKNARLDYGVVINPESLDIDNKATQKLRNRGYERE